MRVHRLLVLIALCSTLISGLAAVAHAQPAGIPPLIVVALPGETGDLLAARLQARLATDGSGYVVQRYSGPIRSEDAANRLARYHRYRPLVVWQDAESDVARLTRTWFRSPTEPESITSALAFDPDSNRQWATLIRALAGEALVAEANCPAALAHLDLAISLAPDNWPGLADVYYYRAFCRADAPDPQQAMLDDLLTAADHTPTWYVYHAVAWTYFNRGEVNQAINAMSEAIERDPQRVQLYFDRAAFYESQGNPQAPFSDYNMIISLEPDNAAAYEGRARLHLQTSHLEAALEDYNTVVTLKPDDPYAWLGRAEILTMAQAFEEARADVDTALALDPQPVDPFLFQRGLLNLYLGDYAASIADLRTYTARRPEDVSGWINLAQAHEGLGETFSAIQSYETAFGLDPSATYLYSTLAQLYYEAVASFDPESPQAADYLDLTINAATAAVASYERDATAHVYRALAYIAQDRNEYALEDLGIAIDLNPSFAAAYYNRAIVYTRLGDAALDSTERNRLYHAAIDDYAMLFQLDFNSYSYLLPFTGYLYVELGDFQQAAERFAAYDEQYPASPPNQTDSVYRGRAYMGTGQFDRALAAFEDALSGDTAFYTCEAQLSAGILTGRIEGDYQQATELLQYYLDSRCTTNPILKAGIIIHLHTWEQLLPG